MGKGGEGEEERRGERKGTEGSGPPYANSSVRPCSGFCIDSKRLSCRKDHPEIKCKLTEFEVQKPKFPRPHTLTHWGGEHLLPTPYPHEAPQAPIEPRPPHASSVFEQCRRPCTQVLGRRHNTTKLHTTQISTWLASIPIVSVLRNIHWYPLVTYLGEDHRLTGG